MEILEKITRLRTERHWSEYQLSEYSGITQSTISSWYRKNSLPSIPSLQKICDAFGLTLSQFFLDDNNRTVLLNEQQLSLLSQASKLSEDQQKLLTEFLKSL